MTLPMFDIADTALAVANALPEVLDAASEVIGSNASDGVAEWMTRNFPMPGPAPL